MSDQLILLDESRAARRIGLGRRSVTGRFIVKGDSVPFESSLERDLLCVLDFDRGVEGVVAQPIRIGYRDSLGQRRSYTPDFLAKFVEGPPVIYEVKYREELRVNWAALRPRFRAAVGYARRQGARFRIMTDLEIRGPYLQNAMFLGQYRDRPRDEVVEEHLVRTIAVLGETTPMATITAAYWTAEHRMQAVAALWRIIAIGRVQADLFEPLTMDTPIWVVTGEGFL